MLVIAVEDAPWATGARRLAEAAPRSTSGARRDERPARAAGARLPRRGARQDPHRPAQAGSRRRARPAPPPIASRADVAVRTAVGGHPADPPRATRRTFYPAADPRSRGRCRRCAAPGGLRLHGGRAAPAPRPISARSGEAPSSRPRSRRRQASSTRSRAASISCCRSRRSTAARRCERFFADGERPSRPSSTTAR